MRVKNFIGQHFVGGFDGTEITPAVVKLVKKYYIGGFVLFSRNIESVVQVAKLIGALKKLSRTPLFIAVDHEGGPVFRLPPPFTVVPPMSYVGKYYGRTRDLKTVEKLGMLLGRELGSVGFNWNYAPVVDVHSNPKNPVIGKRAFGPDPSIVTRCGGAVIRGLHAEGILSCAKHFPGHGATRMDSHLALPVLKASGRLLWKRDLFPYRKLVSGNIIKSIMTAHVLYSELDPENCATLSKPILTGLLRKKLNFRGLIVSDDLWMKAVSNEYGIGSAAVMFFRAGGDVALICRNPEIQMDAMEKVASEAGRDKSFRDQLSRSGLRIKKIKDEFLKRRVPADFHSIGCPEHQKIVRNFY